MGLAIKTLGLKTKVRTGHGGGSASDGTLAASFFLKSGGDGPFYVSLLHLIKENKKLRENKKKGEGKGYGRKTQHTANDRVEIVLGHVEEGIPKSS